MKMKQRMMQRVGDMDKVCWSIKEIAFTLTANAQSKVQLVIEAHETASDKPAERKDR